jgi:hypothetical protein
LAARLVHPPQPQGPAHISCQAGQILCDVLYKYKESNGNGELAQSSMPVGWCFAVLCCALLCFAVLCCALLCFAVLCCALLCFAVLCCALLCFAVPCWLALGVSTHLYRTVQQSKLGLSSCSRILPTTPSVCFLLRHMLTVPRISQRSSICRFRQLTARTARGNRVWFESWFLVLPLRNSSTVPPACRTQSNHVNTAE